MTSHPERSTRPAAGAPGRRSTRPATDGRPASAAAPAQVCQVLVLQGGGALGAYQAGAFEALSEAGRQPEWVAGISIGAINAALIAGNAPADRLPRLRAFWTSVSGHVPALPFAVPDGPWRQWANDWSAGWGALFGLPNFFRPNTNPMSPLTAPSGVPGLYDTEPLRTTLRELVDFDRINRADAVRLSVGAVQVDSGNFSYFDNRERRIGPEHIMASGALPPGFPAVQADGEAYWDGGLVSNTPLAHVVDHLKQPAATIFQVDLFSARGPLPRTADQAADRENDIRYSSRTRAITDRLKQRAEHHQRVRTLVAMLPAAQRNSRQVQQWLAEATDPAIDLVHLIRRPAASETSRKGYEFSRQSMQEHWAAGLADMRHSLRLLDSRTPAAAAAMAAGQATAIGPEDTTAEGAAAAAGAASGAFEPCAFRVFDFGRRPA